MNDVDHHQGESTGIEAGIPVRSHPARLRSSSKSGQLVKRPDGRSAWHRDVMEIRPARKTDLAAVKSIAAAAFEVYVGRIGQKPAPMLVDYDEAIAAGEVWIAVDEPVVSGFNRLIAQAGHLLLDVVAVDPARQGRGIGGQLIAFAEDHARRTGLREIRLYTNEAMVENLQIYPRLGYREVQRSARSGFRRVHFTKDVG